MKREKDPGETIEKEVISISRRLPECEGVYIKGKVDMEDVHFTVDTGASRTILSTRVYNKMEENVRPKLDKQKNNRDTLVGAGRNEIQIYGRTVFNVELGPLQLDCEMIVADIDDDVLLGMDVMQHKEHGKADILLSQGIVRMRGHSIPFVWNDGKELILRLSENRVIPPSSEVIVDAFVERKDNLIDESGDLMIQPRTEFLERNSVMMASTVVNVTRRVTVPCRILNLNNEEVSLHQNTVIGTAESCTVETTELPTECIRKVKKETSDSEENGVPSYLKSLYDESVVNLTESESFQFQKFLTRYGKAFSKDEWDLGATHLVEHEIDTGLNRPIKQPPRRVPLALAQEEKDAIINLQEKGIIRPSTSPWASPIVLAKKKNGKIRVCVDYRKVNNVTTKDAFPLPRVQDCLDSVAGAKLFSTLDLTAGYHQVKVKESDIPKTAFVTKYGHYEYTTMPFGLTNAPGTFQRLMELTLSGLQWNICLIYIDDIIVFGKTFKEHLDRLDQVVRRVQEAGLKLKPEKCQLFQDEVVFLGHRVNKDGILPDKANIEKVVNWSIPRNPTEIRQFLGTATYYRRFVKGFSSIAKPLTELTQKDKPFHWSNECQQAFEHLKRELTGPEIMGHPDPEQGDFILDCDACDVGIGGVLSQIQNGRERVIYYGSRTLNKAERNYCVTDKELLAVRHFVEYFRQYLLGRHFVVRTDHQALVWLVNLKEPKGRVARWIEILSAYNFSVEFRQGVRHGNADGLSRCPNPFECDCSNVDNLETLKCGPCKKCRSRANNISSENETNTRKVSTRQQN